MRGLKSPLIGISQVTRDDIGGYQLRFQWAFVNKVVFGGKIFMNRLAASTGRDDSVWITTSLYGLQK